jgi:hypothetical protein
MAPRLSRPVSPDADVRRIMGDARRRMRHDCGYWLPPARRSYVYTDANYTVTIYGPGLVHNGLADYQGPHGHKQAYIGKTIGKVF